MNEIDLAFTPALELAELIRRREVTPLELVEVYLDRIQRLNPQLGSYFTVTAELAIADAKAKNELLTSNNSELPPFFGVPISIKDLNPVAGVTCTYGSPVLLNHIADYDDGVVTRIKQAGFIILGKTATSELGSFPYSEPTGFPPSRNPWNLEYTSGGSSGGAAASVAAGLCAIAQGSDGGGSIRGPAACCGLVGIKPARGRVTRAPSDRLAGIATEGTIARTVADAAAMLDAISGYFPGDPYWLPDPQPSFLAATQIKVANLRIAFSTSIPPVGEADTTSTQGVLKTVQLLEELGHHLEQKCPDFSGLIEPFQIVWQAGVAATGLPAEAMQPMNRWLLSRVGSVAEYLQGIGQLQIVSRQIIAFFDTVDVLVLPVYLHPPILVGEWADLTPEETFQNIIQWIAPSPIANATGLPAIAIPVGFDHNGLPIAVQLIGKPAAESTLISLAAELEVANPWIQHRPKIAIE